MFQIPKSLQKFIYIPQKPGLKLNYLKVIKPYFIDDSENRSRSNAFFASQNVMQIFHIPMLLKALICIPG